MPSKSCKESLGEPVGHWDAVHVPYDRSVVPLPGEPAPFPEVAPTTYFTNLFPTLQLNLTKDCAWWMRMLPMGVDKTKVVQGFLFPKETTELPDFQANVGRTWTAGSWRSPRTTTSARTSRSRRSRSRR